MHIYSLDTILDDIIKSERIYYNINLASEIKRELVYSKKWYYTKLYSEHYKVGDGVYRPMGLIKSIRLYIDQCSITNLEDTPET